MKNFLTQILNIWGCILTRWKPRRQFFPPVKVQFLRTTNIFIKTFYISIVLLKVNMNFSCRLYSISDDLISFSPVLSMLWKFLAS